MNLLRRIPAYVWASFAAGLLLICGVITPAAAARAFCDSLDVVAFLIGMMLLSEIASAVGIFELLAERAALASGGSGVALYGIVYGCGVLTTALLSNDATAIVLTPAVAGMARRAKVNPLPLVLACVFVANAASFLLPVANPANLVIYGSRPLPLLLWVGTFFVPSLAAITVNGLLLWLTQRNTLSDRVVMPSEYTSFTTEMRVVTAGTCITATVLFAASQFGWSLGPATLLCSLVLLALMARNEPARIATCLRGVSWDVLLLVAALFIITAAADHAGITPGLGAALTTVKPAARVWGVALLAGAITGASILANNLPIGLLSSHVLAEHAPLVLGLPHEFARRVAVIAIDLGPNIATTASLATMLWLQVLKKASIEFSGLAFLRLGVFILPLSLAAALAVLR